MTNTCYIIQQTDSNYNDFLCFIVSPGSPRDFPFHGPLHCSVFDFPSSQTLHRPFFTLLLGSSVDRARNIWSGNRGFDPSCGRPLPTSWAGVSIMRSAEIEVMVSWLYLMCGSTWNCQTSVLGPVREIA